MSVHSSVLCVLFFDTMCNAMHRTQTALPVAAAPKRRRARRTTVPVALLRSLSFLHCSSSFQRFLKAVVLNGWLIQHGGKHARKTKVSDNAL